MTDKRDTIQYTREQMSEALIDAGCGGTQLDGADERADVLNAFGKLPDEQQRLLAYYLAGYTNQEIASIVFRAEPGRSRARAYRAVEQAFAALDRELNGETRG